MPISDFNENLGDLNARVQTFATESIAAINDERFASLPGRYQQAGELALELAGVLEAISTDMEGFKQVIEPISWWAAEKRKPLVRRTEQLVAEPDSTINWSGSEELVGLIKTMGIDGLANLARMIENETEALPLHIAATKELAENAKGYAAGIPQHLTTANEEFSQKSARFNEIVTNKLNTSP